MDQSTEMQSLFIGKNRHETSPACLMERNASMSTDGVTNPVPLFDNSQGSKRSLGGSIRAGFQSIRRKTSSWSRSKKEDIENEALEGESESDSGHDSNDGQISLFDTQRHRNSYSSTVSSTRSHKVRFWLNSYEAGHELSNNSYPSAHSLEADKSDTIVYKCPSRHRVRFWLNEKNPYGFSDSILEVRQSVTTARIIRARHLANIAAVEASKMGEFRRKVRAAKFASAATAAAFVRFKNAEKDVNASHGSIANAAMYASRAVAAASIIQPQKNWDFIKLQNKFNDHFKYKNDPDYFRRIKYIPMKDLNKKSTEYRMNLKLRAIPTPPRQYDIYKFHSDRLDMIIAKGERRRSEFYTELNAARNTRRKII